MAQIYVLSQEAVRHIDKIFEFGEHNFGNAQALKYLIGLTELFEKLSINPGIGRKRNEINSVLNKK
ncbi:MAG: type II toxin-antitoxin system RelE/ParE family toxin [Bacteroidota bacterium]